MFQNSPSSLKILTVDDDRITQLFLKTFLCKSGHTVVQAGNGAEAIEAFDQCNPDIILMDVAMPVMTGYEVAYIIKQRTRNHFVPIIFLTALEDDESIVKCVESGGDDFLAKPINKVLLTAKITAMQRISTMNRELALYKKRTEEEIELTHHVFHSLTKRMMSNKLPGIDYWLCSAGHFSGDLMIYDQSPSGKLYLMLGDFTGHGLSAAIGALPTSDVFFAMTRRNFSAVDIVIEINRKLREIMPSSHFCATAFVCVDPEAQRIEIFNGGLPPILLLDSDGNVKTRIRSANLALGILPAEAFNAEIIALESVSKSTLVVYSDGITEARNEAGEMFGDDRLSACLQTGQKPLESVKAALQDFVGERAFDDDVSLVTLSI